MVSSPPGVVRMAVVRVGATSWATRGLTGAVADDTSSLTTDGAKGMMSPVMSKYSYAAWEGLRAAAAQAANRMWLAAEDGRPGTPTPALRPAGEVMSSISQAFQPEPMSR